MFGRSKESLRASQRRGSWPLLPSRCGNSSHRSGWRDYRRDGREATPLLDPSGREKGVACFEPRQRSGINQPRLVIALKISSGVMGSDFTLTPTASSTALAIAGATGMIAVSPIAMLL